MRLLEILIPIPLTIYLFWPIFTEKENSRLVSALPIVSTALIVAHLLVDGFRWQMLPLFIMTGIILATAVPELIHPVEGEFERMSWSTAGIAGIFFLVVISTALPALLPVPKIPAPGGLHQVGTRSFALTDESRRELYSDNEGPRKFMIQVWYPANPNPDDQQAPWMNDARTYGRAISKYLGLPAFFLDHLKFSYTPAWQDAPLDFANGGYPIILFSHGWNGFAAQNSGQAIELASRGYIVVAIEHTYGAAVTVFPDGEIAYNNPSALPDNMPEPGYTQAARKLVDQWAHDISFTLDYMTHENQNPSSLFYSSVNLDWVGAYGHSTGAGAVIQFCGTDERCKSVLGMDTFMTPISELVLENGLSQPAFFMFSQNWIDDTDSKNNRLFKRFYQKFGPSTHVIEILETAHYDFSDLPMLSPIAPQLGLKGSINGKRITEINNSYLTIFFNLTLKEYATDYFNGDPPFAEVIKLDYWKETVQPIRMNFADGRDYFLGEGHVNNGQWIPQKAEWLVGTEISRWVSLPWSPELEANVTDLKTGDQIELTMSNFDVLVYKVNSIQKMKMEELLASDATKPALLVVIFNEKEADGEFWVVSAIP